MFKTQKSAFWQALILALILFNIGVFLGYMLEKNRIQTVDDMYAMSELNLLDIRAQNDIYSLVNLSCGDAINETLNFADRIYNEAKILQDYEDASRLTDALILRHKKYDLLRAQLWINSIALKKRCPAAEYHTVAYIYYYGEGNLDLEVKAEQEVFSRALGGLKAKYGDKIILLPIAGDGGFGSINLLKKSYNITNMPVILVDEKYQFIDISRISEIDKYLN